MGYIPKYSTISTYLRTVYIYTNKTCVLLGRQHVYLIGYAINYTVVKTMLNHPQNHHFYRWYGYLSLSWVVYDIVLTT